ncbi:hypothetical protein M3172_20620 [Mesobacillus subterraneus]|uniref:hypothetical protein n=1 Tax=Mesobacillus subterraneus TaxID=285983 RepID=UPI00203F034D|nr:hypothetical protein [Mesobacillus subterraneus]MCM3575600.1 hypothetical protein [Mesobacillus subterraneus]
MCRDQREYYFEKESSPLIPLYLDTPSPLFNEKFGDESFYLDEIGKGKASGRERENIVTYSHSWVDWHRFNPMIKANAEIISVGFNPSNRIQVIKKLKLKIHLIIQYKLRCYFYLTSGFKDKKVLYCMDSNKNNNGSSIYLGSRVRCENVHMSH